ncbi:hypothetical protein Q8W71_32555 [Methylobacterium sp. NEAU 140]|uniref:hypothetical protein n=1 Tax=Methylobacterium sp. NEAU 140 TaxID=3064945 RepID=UPI0027374EBF|nr:hypothetical protein [Methylobacterium sp. NEAU 140]MDP4027295.1 hypothetical protein [Methylobacterium sp. NEAU 140]
MVTTVKRAGLAFAVIGFTVLGAMPSSAATPASELGYRNDAPLFVSASVEKRVGTRNIKGAAKRMAVWPIYFYGT